MELMMMSSRMGYDTLTTLIWGSCVDIPAGHGKDIGPFSRRYRRKRECFRQNPTCFSGE
ncbi:hypothetical protein GMO_22100 [Gluconobacter morbifer G707]|uniref:Uncharacterized protein n=1 Tax=Gluconobacter morbifer G707 TaxID=1088869 RepID=G6XLG1_9PROT|nr:hypothetical protein GMO_22100 [Gluconobacter morbifer G707]